MALFSGLFFAFLSGSFYTVYNVFRGGRGTQAAAALPIGSFVRHGARAVEQYDQRRARGSRGHEVYVVDSFFSSAAS